MVLLSFNLKRMEPFTVHAEMTPSCCLMAVSLVKVALVRSSKKGYFIRGVLAAPLLVLLEGVGMAVLGSLGEKSFRLRNTTFLQYLEKNLAITGLGPSPLPGRMCAVSRRASRLGTCSMSPFLGFRFLGSSIVTIDRGNYYSIKVLWQLTGVSK